MKLNKRYRQMLEGAVDEMCGDIVDYDITDVNSADMNLSVSEVMEFMVPSELRPRVKVFLLKRAKSFIESYNEVNALAEC